MKYKFNVPMDFFSAKIVIQLLLAACWSSVMASSQGVLCSCYAFHNQTKTWTESEFYCRSKGGHLVSMETEEEWSLINSEIQKRNLIDNEWYIGLFNNTVAWEWISHYNLTYDKWQSNEPSFSHSSELENCVIMARNYPAHQKGRFNNVRCHEKKPFICEYKQGHGNVRHCDVLEPKYCWNSTDDSAGSSQITIIVKGTDPNPTLVYVVIVLGILLAAGFGFYFYAFYCMKKSTTEHRQDNSKRRFKYRRSTQSEEDSAPSQAELLAETNVQDESDRTDSKIETLAERQETAQVNVENSSRQKYITLDSGSTSTYAALYSSIAVEEMNPEEYEHPTASKTPFPYHEVSEKPAVVYATVDKSKNAKEVNSQAEGKVVYATVDKSKKAKERNSQADVKVVYATVDKSKKAKEGNSQVEVKVVYAKVDKSHKNNT